MAKEPLYLLDPRKLTDTVSYVYEILKMHRALTGKIESPTPEVIAALEAGAERYFAGRNETPLSDEE